MKPRASITKSISGITPSPNLTNYTQAVAAFSWHRAEKEYVDFFDDSTLNIAYNCLTRHAIGAKAHKTALDYIDHDGNRKKYTFAEFDTLSNKFANVLKAEQVQCGDRVFIFMPTIPERSIAFLGILKTGAVAGTLFAAFQEAALLDRLCDSEASVVVTTADLYERIRPLRDQLPCLKTVIVVGKKATHDTSLLSYEHVMAHATDDFEVAHMQKTDPAYMLYTSGTTGKPKGVIHSHGDILQAIITTKDVLDLHDDDVYWCTADIGWVTGIVYGILGVWGLGVTQVMYGGKFSPENWYGVMQRTKTTVFYTAPTAIRMLMASPVSPKDYNLKALRHLCSVGEPLNPEAIWWGLEAFGLPFHDTWWQTELGGICISNYPSLDIRPGSMGKPLPGITAAIIDDNGKPVATGVEGNLALRKSTLPALMKTIWKRPEKYAECFKGDWYISGDRALVDGDGYFWFIGRADDLINTAGERVGPFEIESILVGHPAVVEAAVIGKPDMLRGEIIKAFVVVQEDITQDDQLAADLRQYVKEKLAGHAYPREISFIDRLPKTRSGKIMRRILKAQEMDVPVGDTSTLEEF
ncbi:MAG TPA: acetate--CoA ligase [Candidatus Saccharimonadales bacterium]